MNDIQEDVGEWARGTFGPDDWTERVRASRLLEEAIELAQAEGVTPSDMLRIMARTLSRPAGEPIQELGGVMITALAYGHLKGVRIGEAAQQEWDRVQSKSTSHFAARNAAKKADGLP